MTALEQRTVAIVGAGLMGCSIATDLARRGAQVTVLERAPGPGLGSTSASSAIVRFHYSTESGTALAYEGLHYWRNWADHIGFVPEDGLVKLVTTGMVGLIDQTGHAERCKPILDRLGIPNEWWDTEELRRRLPYLDAGEFWPPSRPEDAGFFDEPADELLGALYEPEAGYVNDPQLAARNLHDAAVAAGAQFRFGSTVVGVASSAEGDGTRQVGGLALADGTEVLADIVINAAGPHSSAIDRLAGLEGTTTITTRPMRQEVHVMPAPVSPEPGTVIPALGDGDSGFYFRPEGSEHLLVGSFEPDCDPLEWLEDADVFEESFGPQWEAQTLRVARRIPELGVPHDRRGVVGVYDASSDWLPIYDRTDLGGYYVAIGTSGNQFKNGGPVGFLMAELIEAVESGHDHDADPISVTGPYSGLTIDLGTFARNRSIGDGTSMSVRG
ncbi:MAG: FAD-dependent oxidoreductase [Actinomycetota bacterium]